jgi:hypothetical protein
MRASRVAWSVFVWAALVAVPSSTYAQDAASSAPVSAEDVQRVRDELNRLKQEFEILRQHYDLRISSLERRLGGPSVLNAVYSVPPAPAPAPAVTPASNPPIDPPQAAPAEPQAQSLAGASKVFNPDTAVIGNFVGVGGKNPNSDQPALSMSEVEVAFQAIVDPFARADFFLAATPEGLEVEEGFATFTSLPGNLLLKVGKMRASFGKVNATHAHVMPTADRPLVTQNLVGGEDGISDSGLSLSKLILNPAMYVEATGEVFRGESNVFHSRERSQLSYVGRVRAYRDVTEGTNLDVGTSFAYGPTDVGPVGTNANKQLFGVDATFRYRPLRRAIYKRFQGRTELVWSRQDIPAGAQQNAFGFYALGEYQFARRWYFGARYDQSGRTVDASLKDTGGSLFLTFWPSEFSQIRTQYRRTNYAEGTAANELLFQFRFGIGAHAAHVF